MSPKQYDPVIQIEIAPILEHLGGYNVPRMSAGRTKLMLCIFHSEQTPSASVGEYSYRCFGCGRKGDAISLIQEEEGLGFQDAYTRAQALAGVADPAVREEQWSGSIFDL